MYISLMCKINQVAEITITWCQFFLTPYTTFETMD